MAKIHQRTLPNGMSVYYRSKVDVDILARELLQKDNLYLRHGIRLDPGCCVFDVGANIGFFVLLLNQMIPHGSVYAFEPIPDVFEVLKLNTDRHNRLELHALNCGLSSRSGEASFSYVPRTSVASTMVPDTSEAYRANSRKFILEELRLIHPVLRWAVDHSPAGLWYPITEVARRYYQSSKQVSCRLRRLSDVIRDERVEVIDLLKVDTEGAEEEVLAGIDDEHWPRIRQAVVEVHRGPQSLASMEALLQSRGFSTCSQPVVPGVDHLHVVYARRGSPS